MQLQPHTTIRGTRQFFSLIFAYDTLENFMRTNFSLMQHHNYGYDELMGMLAWERSVYVTLLRVYLKEENERVKLEQATKR